MGCHLRSQPGWASVISASPNRTATTSDRGTARSLRIAIHLRGGEEEEDELNHRSNLLRGSAAAGGVFLAGGGGHVGWRHVRASPALSSVMRNTRTCRFCLSRFLRSPTSCCECVYLYMEMPLPSISIAPACARADSM